MSEKRTRGSRAARGVQRASYRSDGVRSSPSVRARVGYRTADAERTCTSIELSPVACRTLRRMLSHMRRVKASHFVASLLRRCDMRRSPATATAGSLEACVVAYRTPAGRNVPRNVPTLKHRSGFKKNPPIRGRQLRRPMACRNTAPPLHNRVRGRASTVRSRDSASWCADRRLRQPKPAPSLRGRDIPEPSVTTNSTSCLTRRDRGQTRTPDGG